MEGYFHRAIERVGMTKDTARDRVWAAALRLADRKADETRRHRRRFSVGEVRTRVEDAPSDRTIRDVLATMADYGFLEAKRQGQYAPAEW